MKTGSYYDDRIEAILSKWENYQFEKSLVDQAAAAGCLFRSDWNNFTWEGPCGCATGR
jgi:hypothetical protein